VWTPKSLTLDQRSYTFDDRSGRAYDDLALVADSKVIANMVRATEWSEPACQLIVCDQCGTLQCVPGNFAAVRRLGDFVAFVASPRAFAGGPDSTEYAPPSWMLRAGGLLVTAADWEALRREHGVLPAWERLQPASWTEVALQVQLEAPQGVLGAPGRPLIGLGVRLMATDPWLSPEDLATVEGFFSLGSPGQALRLEASSVRPVTFTLEDPFVQLDVVFRASDGRLGLWLAPGLAVVPS